MASTFDRCAFDHRYRKGQYHEDMREASLTSEQIHESGHIIFAPGRTIRWIPAFYANDAQLRAVLVQAVIGYCFRAGRIPSNLADDLKVLTAIALEEQADIRSGHKAWNVTMQHLAAIQEAGSYLAFIAGISYRAWRLRWHSKDIALESGITIKSVADILCRLVMYAERLGFPTYKPRWVESRQPKVIRKKYQCPHGQDLEQRPYCVECRREYQKDYFKRNPDYYKRRYERKQLERFIKSVAWG